MSIKTYTAEEILELTKIKPWLRIKEPSSLWENLNITLTEEQQEKVKFAPLPEMLVLKNPKTGPYEGWRTIGGNWATVFALTPDDKVISVIEFKHGVEEVMINLPAGNIKSQEDISEALRRELLEETGFMAKKIEPLGKPEKGFGISGRKSSTRFFSFLGTDLEKIQEPTLDPDEEIETAFVELKEWLKMIEGGIVLEASAIVTTFLALKKLGRL